MARAKTRRRKSSRVRPLSSSSISSSSSFHISHLTFSISFRFRFLPYVGYVTIAMVRAPPHPFLALDLKSSRLSFSNFSERLPAIEIRRSRRVRSLGSLPEGTIGNYSRSVHSLMITLVICRGSSTNLLVTVQLLLCSVSDCRI